MFKSSTVILCKLILNDLRTEKRISFSLWKALDYLVGRLCNSCIHISLDACKSRTDKNASKSFSCWLQKALGHFGLLKKAFQVILLFDLVSMMLSSTVDINDTLLD